MEQKRFKTFITSNTVEEKELQENQDTMKKTLLIQRRHQRKDVGGERNPTGCLPSTGVTVPDGQVHGSWGGGTGLGSLQPDPEGS